MEYKVGDNIIITELGSLQESSQDIIINSKLYKGKELKYYQQNLQGRTIHHTVLGNIYLGSAGRKETEWRSRGKYLSIICFIDKIIETGYSNGLSEKPNHERINDNIQNFYSIYNEVIYDNMSIGVTVIIYEDLMGRKYYMFRAYKNENLVSNCKVFHTPVEELRQHQVNYIINENKRKVKYFDENYKEILRKEDNMKFKELTEKLKKYLIEPQENDILFDDMEDETGMNIEETLQKEPMNIYNVVFDTPGYQVKRPGANQLKVKATTEQHALEKAKKYANKYYMETQNFRITNKELSKYADMVESVDEILYTVYYNTDTPNTCGSVKVKATSEEEAINKAKSYITKKYPEADTFRIGANNNNSHIDIVEEVDNSLLKHEPKFRYMMLDRMKQDCNYFLGNGDGYEGHLWAGSVEDQIDNMRNLWNSFTEDEKPEWLTMEDIDKLEKKMLTKKTEKQNIKEEATFTQLGTTPTPTFTQAKIMGKPVQGKKHKKDEVDECLQSIERFLNEHKRIK